MSIQRISTTRRHGKTAAQRKPRYARTGRMLYDRGKPIMFLERELDETGYCPITPHQADLLAERIVRLLNRGK